jgi:hypothetical protein
MELRKRHQTWHLVDWPRFLQSTLSARLIARLPECCAFDEWTGGNDDLLFRQAILQWVPPAHECRRDFEESHRQISAYLVSRCSFSKCGQRRDSNMSIQRSKVSSCRWSGPIR